MASKYNSLKKPSYKHALRSASSFVGSPPYDPASWNNTPITNPDTGNCYSYALNYRPNPIDPGQDGLGLLEKANTYSPSPEETKKFTDAVITGAKHDGLKFTGANIKSARGYYKAALFIKPATGGPNDADVSDYHWLRQDSNGRWSHKLGPSPVTNRDSKGALITDPTKAAINEYSFVGYFDVPKNWKPDPGKENNLSTINNPISGIATKRSLKPGLELKQLHIRN